MLDRRAANFPWCQLLRLQRLRRRRARGTATRPGRGSDADRSEQERPEAQRPPDRAAHPVQYERERWAVANAHGAPTPIPASATKTPRLNRRTNDSHPDSDLSPANRDRVGEQVVDADAAEHGREQRGSRPSGPPEAERGNHFKMTASPSARSIAGTRVAIPCRTSPGPRPKTRSESANVWRRTILARAARQRIAPSIHDRKSVVVFLASSTSGWVRRRRSGQSAW